MFTQQYLLYTPHEFLPFVLIPLVYYYFEYLGQVDLIANEMMAMVVVY
jgi:hypothetical protein